MKEYEQTQLINWLSEEQLHKDTIFLHSQNRKWIAYGNSALLLRNYAPNAKIKTIFHQGQRLLRAEWQGSLHFKAGAAQPRRRLFPMPDPEQIIIHCR